MKYATGYLGSRQTPDTGQFQNAVGRHNSGSNFLFADGYARYLQGHQVSSGHDAANQNAPQMGSITGSAAGTANPAFTATFSLK